jgi:carbonic anhydrase
MQSIKNLSNGYKRFKKKYFVKDNSLFEELARGQRPRSLVVSCCDSRVDPAIVFDSEPGELFIIRNVASLVPPYNSDGGVHGVSAALEFAVCSLEVENIIILGHSQCGGIMALLGNHPGEFVTQWMKIAEPAKKQALIVSKGKSREVTQINCEHAAIKLSYNNLKTFPWISKRIEEKRLSIFGWYFDLGTGLLKEYDYKSDKFVTLE